MIYKKRGATIEIPPPDLDRPEMEYKKIPETKDIEAYEEKFEIHPDNKFSVAKYELEVVE